MRHAPARAWVLFVAREILFAPRSFPVAAGVRQLIRTRPGTCFKRLAHIVLKYPSRHGKSHRLEHFKPSVSKVFRRHENRRGDWAFLAKDRDRAEKAVNRRLGQHSKDIARIAGVDRHMSTPARGSCNSIGDPVHIGFAAV